MPRHTRRTRGGGLWNFLTGKTSGPPVATPVAPAPLARSAIPVATDVVSDPTNPTEEERQRQQLDIIYDRLAITPTQVDTDLILDAVHGRPRTVNGLRLRGTSPLDRQIMLKAALQRLTPQDKYRLLSVVKVVFPVLAMPAHQLLLDVQKDMAASYQR
jgi:hypothetical protein